MNLAPIILFVYNRPWHTEQTLEALMLNELANESTLYIYCDGPKINDSDESLKSIKEVRTVIRKKNWCKEVIIIEREENLGLANSVIKGITEVVNRHGSIIVLEDDIVTGKYFLKFMNDSLNMYEKEAQVFGVSGYCFPGTKKIKDTTYFLPIMSSWGYGTWSRAWEQINFDGSFLLKQINLSNKINEFNFGSFNYYQMLVDQVNGRNNSWAVRFYTSMFLKQGVFLFPNISFLKNIGFDGTGVHCGKDIRNIYNARFQDDSHLPVIENKVRLKQINMNIIKNEILNSEKNILKILKKKLIKLLPPELIQFYKRKYRPNGNLEFEFLAKYPRYTKTKIELFNNTVDIPDSASFLFMFKEIFRENIYKFKTSILNPYIIDGGANIGLATIYFKRLYPFSEIIAFEPDPDIFKILKNNILSFGFDKIELIEKGLWNKNEIVAFKSEGADAGLVAELDNTITSTNKIEVVSLRPYINRTVDFLKLDIEGAETLVLEDIEDDLDKVVRIFVEYHSFVGQKQSLNKVIDILTKANFRLYISSPGVSSKSPFNNISVYNNMDMQLNIYGIKKD